MNSLSIVMPVFNAPGVVRKTLGYLIATGVDGKSIYVCDDNSDPECMQKVAFWAEDQGINWHRNDENIGYTRNVNAGIQRSNAEYTLVLNSDCFIRQQTIDCLAKVLSENEYIGCIGPLSSNAGNQTVRFAREILWDVLNDAEITLYIDAFETKLAVEYGSRPWFSPSVNGFCCLWKTQILHDIGCFDEVEFPRGYGEEDDACLRMLEAGHIPVIAPFAYAPHLKTKSFSVQERDSLKQYAQDKLRMKFSNIHIDRLLNFFSKSPYMKELKNNMLE